MLGDDDKDDEGDHEENSSNCYQNAVSFSLPFNYHSTSTRSALDCYAIGIFPLMVLFVTRYFFLGQEMWSTFSCGNLISCLVPMQ